MKIRICLPFYHEISGETVLGVRDCLKQKEIAWEVLTSQGPLIGQARNFLVNRGKNHSPVQQAEEGIDYFLFVDADIGFQFRHVAALLSQKTEIASGAYLRQREDRKYTAGHWAYKGGKVPGIVDMEKCLTPNSIKGLHVVDYSGGGFLLVRRDVFPNMPYPWFREMIIGVDGDKFQIGEDLGFCVLAGEAQIPVHCDTRVTLYHKPRPQINVGMLWQKK